MVHLCTLNYIIHLLWLGFTILGSERKKKSRDPLRNRVHDEGGEWSTLEVGKIDYDDAEEKGGKEKKAKPAFQQCTCIFAAVPCPDTATRYKYPGALETWLCERMRDGGGT